MKQILAITRKELDSYFGSPMALIFVGLFLVTVHFSFFWVSGFFGRGIADVRPLFEWMPILLILLISTLTMRQWSEEQQTGTLEMLLTTPVRLTQLVIGKFLAVLALVCVALILTLSLPITVGALGSLDLGPVVGGYLAAILMASAYIAIGLFVSSRTDNQIVSLLLTAVICGLFFLVGSSTITSIASTSIADFLRALGTGSRFESIERGVIDLRDLLYYLTVTFIFLMLNILSLDSKRWSTGIKLRNFRFNRRIATILLVLNLLAFNVWMARAGSLRVDLTQNGQYTLSSATKDLLSNVQEPLLIRAYFSQKTHPLLAPLIATVHDTLNEYKVAGGNKVQVEFVDPITDPALEQEANQTYGIKATPLQLSDRGQTSVVNAYFDILIRYGDQNTTLNLLNLIDVKQTGSGDPDIQLRNLEYDLTSAIQKVVYGFQNIDAVLASLKNPATLTLYVTPNTLPDSLKDAPTTINKVVGDIAKASNGKLVFKTVDVPDPSQGVTEQSLADKYQIQAISSGFLSPDKFFLHMVIDADGKSQVIYPSGDMSEAGVKTSIESALKRTSSGFLHVVGLWISTNSSPDPSGQPLQQYNTLQQNLSQNFDLRNVDLNTGQIDNDVDALILIAPQNMTDVQRYAVDQFLMRGGSVFVAAGNYQISVGQDGSLALQPLQNGLQDMLTGYGLTVENKLVLDTQNVPFPVQVQRNVNGTPVTEMQAVNYPQFVDVRSNAMDTSNPSVVRLPEVILNWVSPITIDATKTKDLKVTKLLQSTSNSWTTTTTTTQPNLNLYPDNGFPVEGTPAPETLAVAVQGSFTSFFTGKPSPFTTAASASTATPAATPTPLPAGAKAGFISKSPDTARLIVVGSSEFLNDTLFGLEQRLGVDAATPNIQLIQNSADWFVEDPALATIRAKASSSRVLIPLDDAAKTRWEIGNYIFALLALIGLGVVWQLRRRSEKPMDLLPPAATPVRAGGAK